MEAIISTQLFPWWANTFMGSKCTLNFNSHWIELDKTAINCQSHIIVLVLSVKFSTIRLVSWPQYVIIMLLNPVSTLGYENDYWKTSDGIWNMPSNSCEIKIRDFCGFCVIHKCILIHETGVHCWQRLVNYG